MPSTSMWFDSFMIKFQQFPPRTRRARLPRERDDAVLSTVSSGGTTVKIGI